MKSQSNPAQDLLQTKKATNPEDQIPLDDLEGADKDDQQSQQDVHSNGLDEENIAAPESQDPPIDLLTQSYRAAESSYLLGEEIGSDTRFKSKRDL